VDGESQPLGREETKVLVPLQPGSQTVKIDWRQDVRDSRLLVGPSVDVGQSAVNARVTFHMGFNRWILWTGGPRVGPAVLFWSYLVVILLAALALGRIPWTPLKTFHWMLLGLGLTQAPPLAAIVVAGWILALGARSRLSPSTPWPAFNLTQIALAAWTLASLAGLYLSIQKGLLGIPDMQIAGNGSTASQLHWMQDRIGPTMPRPRVLFLPLYVYRILMLLWALWLAQALLRWLRWGWSCFSEGGLWKKPVLKRRGGKTPPPVPTSESQAKP